MDTISIFLIISILLTQCNGYRVNGDPFRQRQVLDPNGKYVVEWHVELAEKRVTFNVTVETNGYVGLGLNRRGVMTGADIVIGGVLPSGTPYFSDRHASGRGMLVEDASQDWTLHSAHETGSFTYLTFSRAFDTCDNQDDVPLEVHGDVVSLLWAYGESDTDISYHYQNRGSYEVYLLDPDMIPSEIEEAPSFGNYEDGNVTTVGDWNVWTIAKTQTVPENDTRYFCTMHKAPVHNKKMHIVGFRSVLADDNAVRHIHHYLLRRCRPPVGVRADEFFGSWLSNPGEDCYLVNLPPQLSNMPYQWCQEVVHVWGVGGLPNFYPDHVGVPMTESSSDEYYMLEMHWDNPELRRGVEVRFALEIFYTENLRKYDGGVILTGTAVPASPSIMIPPSSIDYKIYGHCGSGRGLQAKHIRNGRELPWIMHDDNYNFNYQQIRTLTRERTVLPGDDVITQCRYETTDRNGSVTIGGFKTRDEMCVTFLFYYPLIRSPNAVYGLCSSEIRSEIYGDFLGIRNTTWSDALIENVVTSPRPNAGLLVSQVGDSIEWTSERRRHLQSLQTGLPQVTICPNQDFNYYREGENEFYSIYDESITPYQSPNTCQKNRIEIIK